MNLSIPAIQASPNYFRFKRAGQQINTQSEINYIAKPNESALIVQETSQVQEELEYQITEIEQSQEQEITVFPDGFIDNPFTIDLWHLIFYEKLHCSDIFFQKIMLRSWAPVMIKSSLLLKIKQLIERLWPFNFQINFGFDIKLNDQILIDAKPSFATKFYLISQNLIIGVYFRPQLRDQQNFIYLPLKNAIFKKHLVATKSRFYQLFKAIVRHPYISQVANTSYDKYLKSFLFQSQFIKNNQAKTQKQNIYKINQKSFHLSFIPSYQYNQNYFQSIIVFRYVQLIFYYI
ncbi:unnamed protein product [Paramecium sonneborni]|uniref:Uncharacterized protein n=1 Tax=Paramecium sonneborni TaxID=65129 RepID=A0A8S1NX73_9CILI|nr:unnamed protein product [Paramecium sonneborni]